MWSVLFVFVLCLVHIQFKYCAQIGIGMLKLVETSVIVLAVRLYSQSDDIWAQVNDTINITAASENLVHSWKTLTEMYH